MIGKLKKQVLDEMDITAQQARLLSQQDLEDLCAAADEIRSFYCGNRFDLCAIVNGKSGRCSEDCKYCAQSAFHCTQVEDYPLLNTQQLCEEGRRYRRQEVLRYSVVTSGKKLTEQEIESLCKSYQILAEEGGISLCASHGLLTEQQFAQLKKAGVTRYHNNLETSRRYFPEICTTHTYDEKIAVIKAAQKAGLAVCSGGIIGMGETMEDRIEMAIQLRDLGICSVPINILNPIAGTPFEGKAPISLEEVRRTVAVFRFLLPKAAIRLAGGRGLLPDKGKSAFCSGANAAITGDMLTTAGIGVAEDKKMLEELGYKIEKIG